MKALRQDLAYLKTKTIESFMVEIHDNTERLPLGVVECLRDCKLTSMDSFMSFAKKSKSVKPRNQGEAALLEHVQSLPKNKRLKFISDFYLELKEDSRMSRVGAAGDKARREWRKKMDAEREGREYVPPKKAPMKSVFKITTEDWEPTKDKPASIVGKFFLGIPDYKRLRIYVAMLFILYNGISVFSLVGSVFVGLFGTPWVMTFIALGVQVMREFASKNTTMKWLCQNLRVVANKMFDVVEGIVSGIYSTFGGDTSKVESAFDRAKIAFMGEG